MAKITIRLLFPLLGAVAVLVGVAALGRWARESLRQDYTLPFAGIECLPPPSAEQVNLLAEVQYLAGMPDRVRLLDDDLAERLRQAFVRHAWVESVEEVQVAALRIVVRLRYRRPVLAVPVDGELRAVDGSGILLPATAKTSGLPIYPGVAPSPAGPAGTPWGDSNVEQQARKAAGAQNRNR
ncbi:MAG TPA: hypothetical protein VKE94_17195 [Gemmataceae bacterium]|nr:hypothetical protein [Gemmataceae bacterium]